MSNTQRHEQRSQEIAHGLAQFIARESNRTSLITVTRVDLTEDNAEAIAYVTVLPESSQNDVLHFLRRNRGEARAFLTKRATIGRVPRIDFVIDFGEINRQRIEELSIESKNKTQENQ